MPSDYTTQSKRPQSAILHSVGPSSPANRPRTRRLSEAVAGIVAVEFLAVGSSAYLASVVYHYVGSGSPPPAYQYVPAAIFIALMVSLFSIGFRQLESVQTQPRHTFLWSGVGAVGLAFA